jgi:transcriptional regulator GlxA family with amidase domain
MPIDIKHAKHYIHQNISKLHTISDVATSLNVSPETLRKTFLRETHETLAHFILNQRLEFIKKHLRETDLLCFEIIYKAGFRREDSAAKIFHRVAGMTMQQYRLSYRKETKSR